ncbi:gluconate 2-dehydrogenase subunit 3 family protein [Rhizorhabdus sp. FW153]|uniref:gluconate 2-dehydrogenase subunit 3 family protein n=1 Tax=Rhizorhabdus sp. FW153 TaxID=3400216 RepID=UPI003CFB8CB3
MDEQQPGGWNRRTFLGAAAILAAVVDLPVAAIRLDLLDAGEAPSERRRDLMRIVSQIVIPRTDTPGAGDVGTGDFVLLGLAHGLEKSRARLPKEAPEALIRYARKDGSFDQAAWLEAELDARSRGDFLRAAPDTQAKLLAALDAEAYAQGVREHPWRTVKALILTGYYTSEPGGSQELQFELVPGTYVPDIPVTKQTRAFSSDWTAVDFG